MRDEKALHKHVMGPLVEKKLKDMSFMELMHIWRYGTLSHLHLQNEEEFWQVVKEKACAELSVRK